MTHSERNVVALAEQDPLRFATSTAAEISHLAATSEATVTRTARKLGFDGIKDFKQACAAQIGKDQSLGDVIRSRLYSLEKKGDNSSAHGTAETVLTASADLLLRLSESLRAPSFEDVVDLIDSSARTVLYGLGTGSQVAGYLSLGLERIGVKTWSMSGSGHTLADDIHRLESRDVLLVIAPRVLFNDIENLIDQAVTRVERVVLISQVSPPQRLSGQVLYLELPSTAGSAASEVTTAWGLSDAFMAEVARRNPTRAIQARNDVQRLRDELSPGKRARSR